MSALPWFASCARGLEPLLARELIEFGACEVRETVAGVACSATLEQGYRIGYCARLPSRWLLRLAEVELEDSEQLYAVARALPWHRHFGSGERFAVHIAGKSTLYRDSRFAMLRVKDAIADHFREHEGARPSVDAESPDARVHVVLKGAHAAISLDLVGGALHERGYRQPGHDAPIKENLAAGLLLRSGWPQIAAAGGAIVDPFCGGGTLLVEALWMAAAVPAQWLRVHFAWERWRGHDAALWERVRNAADAAAQAGIEALQLRAFGSDSDPAAVRLARAQVQAARVAGCCQLQVLDARRLVVPAGRELGLVTANLPYGERLGSERELMPLHREFGAALQHSFGDWRFGLLAGSEALARATGLRADKVHKLLNGAIECLLITGGVQAATERSEGPPRFRSAGAEMVYNRICKNRRRLQRWLARERIECYRVYDADLPEYAAAIDVYGDRLHIQEYAAPADIPLTKTQERLRDLVHAATRAYDFPPERVYLKQRRSQSPDAQYRRRDQSGEFFVVAEAGARFEVNLQDYLDSGLFLDGRRIREWIGAAARGLRFLNLFCYTGSATVAAALGGARASVGVDLSPTYIGWAERNFRLNALDLRRHRLVQDDAVRWLAQCRETFDLIYVDPPTFSNSKRTPTVFDVQRDHAALLRAALRCLAPGGRVLFVCNLRRFKLDPALTGIALIDEVTAASIPPDFTRDPRIHHAYWLRQR
ncbi:MAG: bifunctional 23S rRNA (guanine(2069)-N(7))-methyltransferase RlmK/23S rRNA (guanine(2445)-N(2))-methyltransferase RlmL [Xanthomonadales bacterium PRO6]|nr:Ribosomal RNA large subunit methyltransferase K/L [Xanthomonadales bacterium]MCE7930042.1 bifunctional 23S rRNA (guanine(2069)-N(7))-methyltransferase RlmK/23S rRNA (guanine(2445)-N(2))-methyltransferase RlmL [Xanthomonadales bacterium PRO6]